MKSLLAVITIVIVLTAAVGIPRAQEESADDRTLSPYFFVQGGDPGVDRFPLEQTQVSATVSGVMAEVTVRQRYRNDGTRPIHARYVFPASTRAAVHGMTMTVGEAVIEAQIQKRAEARKTFEKAKKSGRSASLLDQQRPNVFTMEVANILPADTVEIELHYSELLVPEEGTYRFVFPTVVGPRYGNQPEATAPEHDRWVKNPYLREGTPSPSKFDLAVTLSTGLPLEEASCDTHTTAIDYENESLAHVRLADDQSGGDRDFILSYRLAGRQVRSGLMLYEGDEENFFLLMVQPPERVRPEEVPAREYIFVVDVSGSMNGFPLNTAKSLLRDLIGNLRPQDRFNVLLFAGHSELLAPTSLPATSGNIQGAVRFIENRRGGGGTELEAALKRCFDLPGESGMARAVLVITDGYVTAEGGVFERIRENLDRSSVFAFGIGSSVNRYLIEGMARAGQGERFVVTDPVQARETAERFREYVQAPLLTGISLQPEDFEIYDVEPPAVPDLYAGRPVVVFGKWRGPTAGVLRLTGTGGTGQFSREFRVRDIEPLTENIALRQLWARTRVARLSDFSFGRGDGETRDEVTSLALTYSLLTRYTSFVAVHEPIRNPQGEAEDVDQPLPLPLHVSNLAVGGVRKVPEPGLGLLALTGGLVAAAGRWLRRRRPAIGPGRHA